MISSQKNTPAWTADLGDGTYRNPVLYADYSDPDVIRVQDDFYMTASSFASSPGLPILHSKDLVNWKLINHAIPVLPGGYEGSVRHGDGVWAPSIRYHQGAYWIYYSMPDEGIYMVKATHPEGEWTAPHLVKEVKGWIDPCPFWDDDGQAYLVHAFARSRCGIKSKLQICRMNQEGTELLDDGQIVFDGTEDHPTIEGPKMYKREGLYYIFAPAGGVSTGWQTVLRSQHPMGPYEDRIVMHQGDSDVNGPHQGGYVELEDGTSWFLHFQDKEAYGRIVHLQPMQWIDGWPVIGEDQDRDGIGEPVAVYRKPIMLPNVEPVVPQTSDSFDSAALGLQWQWQGNQKREWYSLNERPGWLRLYAVPLPDGAQTLYEAPHIVCQKLPAPAFAAHTAVQLGEGTSGIRTGLVVFGHSYCSLSLLREETGLRIIFARGRGSKEGSVEEMENIVEIQQSCEQVLLKVEVVPEAMCSFSYSLDGVTYKEIGVPFEAVPGGWVGAKLGLFCIDESKKMSGQQNSYADFEYFQVDPA